MFGNAQTKFHPADINGLQWEWAGQTDCGGAPEKSRFGAIGFEKMSCNPQITAGATYMGVLARQHSGTPRQLSASGFVRDQPLAAISRAGVSRRWICFKCSKERRNSEAFDVFGGCKSQSDTPV